MSQPFVIELLRAHEREAFSCGVAPLDRYFKEQVNQDVRRRATVCYVLREVATDAIAGYYTLAASSALLATLPAKLAEKLPRYPGVPVARVGRLAVDKNFRGRRFGGALLHDAAERAQRSEIDVYGLVVDAKDDAAVAFYEHHGFTMLSVEARTLIAPKPRRVPATARELPRSLRLP